MKGPRFKTDQRFQSKNDLVLHDKKVHNKEETEREREGRIQNARWTHLQPDSRLMEHGLNVKSEDLTLLHQDDTHYNIIVPKNHYALRKYNEIEKHSETENKVESGDKRKTINKKSWA